MSSTKNTDLSPSNLLPTLLEKQSVSVRHKQSIDLVHTLTKGTIDDVLNLEQGLSVKDIIVDAIPVSVQIHTHGRARIAQILDIQLIRLAEAMNVKHNLKNDQIKTIVYDLLERYKHETVEDFLLVFKRLRQGYYGDSYHLLNQETIFKAVQTHLEEKYEEHDRMIRNVQQVRKGEESMEKDEIWAAYGAVKNKDGEIEFQGPAVGPRPQKEESKDEQYNQAKADWLRNKLIQQAKTTKTVEGQKEILNELYGDQTQAGTESTERGGTSSDGDGDEQTAERYTL